MAKSFKTLRDQMSAEARKTARVKAQAMLDTMPLSELRQARRLSQQQLAETLNVKQSAVSKLERRTDMYISSLRSFVEAMGGDLEITARFPDGAVRIEQFEQLDETT
jgi:transcriptional regulator with XRE-family HTH domain